MRWGQYVVRRARADDRVYRLILCLVALLVPGGWLLLPLLLRGRQIS
jgi:hypothetical protein